MGSGRIQSQDSNTSEVTAVEEAVKEGSQLDCVDSGNKLQRQKKGSWSLGRRKAKRMHLGEEQGKDMSMLQRVCAWGKKKMGKSTGVQARERERERTPPRLFWNSYGVQLTAAKKFDSQCKSLVKKERGC